MAAQTSQRRLLSRVGIAYILYHVVMSASTGSKIQSFGHALFFK